MKKSQKKQKNIIRNKKTGKRPAAMLSRFCAMRPAGDRHAWADICRTAVPASVFNTF